MARASVAALLYGLRFAHNTDIKVTDLTMTSRTAPGER
jgi:hypothetical protein